VGDFFRLNLDAAAFWVVVPVLCLVVVLAVPELRRRWLQRRRQRPRGVRTRLDVIRRDLYRAAEYLGDVRSDPAVWPPFEHGLAAMAAYQWDYAIEHFRYAQAKASGAQLVPIYNQTGVCQYVRGRLDDALRNFEESARLAKEYGDEDGKAPALGNIGLILHDRGEFGDALKQLSEALAIARKSDDQRVAAPFLASIGNIHRDRREYDEALQYCREALAISRNSGDKSGIARCLGNIGDIHRDKDELDKALKFYEEALALSREIDDLWGTANCLGSIAAIHRYRGEIDEALVFHEDALALERKIGLQAGVATELANFGLILVSKGLYRQAVATLAESLDTLLGIGLANGPRQVLFGLSRCDDRLGRDQTQELLEESGLADGTIADFLDRIDQLRLRRPRQMKARRAPFVLRRVTAGAR
jgi:tetratricopeptide (TPR) repeat protein